MRASCERWRSYFSSGQGFCPCSNAGLLRYPHSSTLSSPVLEYKRTPPLASVASPAFLCLPLPPPPHTPAPPSPLPRPSSLTRHRRHRHRTALGPRICGLKARQHHRLAKCHAAPQAVVVDGVVQEVGEVGAGQEVGVQQQHDLLWGGRQHSGKSAFSSSTISCGVEQQDAKWPFSPLSRLQKCACWRSLKPGKLRAVMHATLPWGQAPTH